MDTDNRGRHPAMNTNISSSGATNSIPRNGGFCGALQRAPPPMPPGLARRLASRECYGVGKVKVMLRVADKASSISNSITNSGEPHFMALDKKKRQVTLTDPKNVCVPQAQERAPMVAAPKMFAFDNLFSAEDKQSDVCAAALSEVIPAVLEGSDGCLLAMGYPGTGQPQTVLGDLGSSSSGMCALGAAPCAIAWLYKGIQERRQKSGARFSVRVSAVGVSATKPDALSTDLLISHAAESDDSPGIYLRDDFLGGPTELRAPTAERAALFLDSALAGRLKSSGNSAAAASSSSSSSTTNSNSATSSSSSTTLESALIFTLHVYQYSLSRKGGVAGGRSRLHIIDLGGCANRNGGLPLSGIGNILLAILSGQRHPPHKDHPLTPLLKDCLAPITCHVAIVAHVLHAQSYQDALSTIQIASRIHRLRRRKHRVPMPLAVGLAQGMNPGAGGSSAGSGADPSSSEISADTVIYMGPHDDATDGEHPPVYLPSLSAGDNRGLLSKALKGSGAEKPPVQAQPKSNCASPLMKKAALEKGTFSYLPSHSSPAKKQQATLSSTGSLKRHNNSGNAATTSAMAAHSSLVHEQVPPGSPLPRHMCSKASNMPTPKGSPLRRPHGSTPGAALEQLEAGMRKITEEQWIDGPRVSRAKVAEARHLMREVNHVKQCETWVDGPKSSQSCRSLTAGNLPTANQTQGYGFMDAHKKTMIRQWVENQTTQVFQNTASASNSPTALHLKLSQLKQKSLDLPAERTAFQAEAEFDSLPLLMGSQDVPQDGDDQDSGPSEVPPALPLLDDPLVGSRDISHDSLHRMLSRHVSREQLQEAELAASRSSSQHPSQRSIDCGLQVTEEEIARTMARERERDKEKDQAHPLAALSHCDNLSFVSSFNMACESFSECGERARHQFDQLARLHEIFTSQLAMAEVTPSAALYRTDVGSVFSEPAFRFNVGQSSVCSEPAYRLTPSPPKQPSHSPSQGSLPSLNGIMEIAGMDDYALLRQPDGASDPSLPKSEKRFAPQHDDISELEEKSMATAGGRRNSLEDAQHKLNEITNILPLSAQSRLPLLPLNTSSEAYDSGHDSSTPRTSKHSGISRRAESGYHSVATVRDSDESSFASGMSKNQRHRITISGGSQGGNYQRQGKKRTRHDGSGGGNKGLCNWLLNPFSCTYPETEGEISDF
ncbi:kinesin-like protein CG14535 isoform X2 [Drosophila nasuta]|uniref:kinesin-like protein CG14535 isoform X2 n=1 Tax=Drosophila nasuta TaxID=42062 RepID=UPI00295F05E3|nr:kinesin-like protein CG14535 isoform X2 [Drosophila nasuta]XP_060655208.1 kinesin-like protein CG14535 isoform X2 [Drosophila nasuta]